MSVLDVLRFAPEAGRGAAALPRGFEMLFQRSGDLGTLAALTRGASRFGGGMRLAELGLHNDPMLPLGLGAAASAGALTIPGLLYGNQQMGALADDGGVDEREQWRTFGDMQEARNAEVRALLAALQRGGGDPRDPLALGDNRAPPVWTVNTAAANRERQR